ncbi:restriction endonuclease subunit S [Rhodococcus qingshengii]|uniref:restriction endonuclease subunit S n=2 Tax=Actinomycetota TaxID=201174 RepID=UPI00287F842F|nr:restriction endonuclease subunit S [Rhodococcus qingshengii]
MSSDDWIRTPISQVTRIAIGGTPSRAVPSFWSDAENGKPWASIADLRRADVVNTNEYISSLGAASSNVKLVAKGTPIMSFKLTIGRTSVAGRDLYTNEAIAAFYADETRLDPRYLFHILPSAAGSVVTDVAIKGATLNKRSLATIPLDLPPLPEQRRIAEILDTVDDQIRATEQIIAKLKLTKQGLVSDLFSGDWPIARIGESATLITSGSRGWARYYSDEGAKFIRIGNLTRTHINLRFDSLVHVRVPSDGEGGRTSLQRGDLLISITADLGIIGVVPSDLGEAYINQHIALVRFNEEESNSRWIGHYLSSPLGRAQFSRLNDQGAKAGLNLPTISNLKFPAPSSAMQRKVVAVLDALDDRVTHAQLEVQKLQKQKQGLMCDLLTGRVRVLLETAL